MSGETRIHRRPLALAQVREAAAYGLLNLGHAIEHDAKADVPVAGGHRSFMTGPKTKAGTPRVGGNLRRSIHSVGYLDGRRLAGPSADDNTKPLPHYAPRHGISVFIGTNCNYGAYVELGTYKMAARPYLRPAALANHARARDLIRAGARRHLRETAR